MTPFLSDVEVAEMCSPLLQAGAQKRYLRRLGMRFEIKPNGRPLVSRSGLQGRLDGFATPGAPAGPNAEAFKALFNKRKGV